MRSASASNSPGVTATSCTQATTPNVPTPPKHQPLLGQIYGFDPFPVIRLTGPCFLCANNLMCDTLKKVDLCKLVDLNDERPARL